MVLITEGNKGLKITFFDGHHFQTDPKTSPKKLERNDWECFVIFLCWPN